MTTINPSDLEENACQGLLEDAFYGDNDLYTNQPDNFTDLPPDLLMGSESISMASLDAFDAKATPTAMSSTEPSTAVDEEARLLCAPGSDPNSPRDIIVSPSGELSSPFSAMESDGEGIETGLDDASLSCTGERMAAQRPSGFFGASAPPEYTTTPCASSSACDDDYESTGSRKKRRKTRRPLHPYSTGSTLHFPKPIGQEAHHDPDTSPFSPPTCPKGLNFNFAESSSRRSSSGINTSLGQEMDHPAENAKRTRTSEQVGNDKDGVMNVKTETPIALDTPVTATKSVVRRGDEQILHKTFPRRVQNYELRIISQPESQHRARYLTEGSRGPVKDATQQGFPKVELIGYDAPAMLQVFVATDSGKVRPHGFYQACKVTGRNTSTCDEVEIDGTKVIEIPFKQESGGMVLSVDCVGILKLRNTDVEMRTGIRNQKRNQSVRLIFRVNLPVSTANRDGTVTVQTASTRISCTQPLGQPEISKKSIDRCSVEGGIEMFIIGRNFHRGTKVIYQDPEEPNGTQWSAEGDVDKDTFHQSHMVVRVPPYHDQDILKPVNVQLLVEYQEKRCEPHSFTYTPRPKEPEKPKQDVKNTAQTTTGAAPNIESALSLLDGPIDKKFLVALFSKLLTGGMAQADSPAATELHEPAKPEALLKQQPAVNPTTITEQQALLNMLQAQSQQLRSQSAGTGPAQVEKNVCADSILAPLDTASPITSIKFSPQPCNLSVSQNMNNTNPIQPASFTPVLSTHLSQVKFTSFPINDNSNLSAPRVKSEIPDTIPSLVATTNLQTIPNIASSTGLAAPLTFVPTTTSHIPATFAPQVSASPSPAIIINPGSLQTSQPSFSKGIVLNTFPVSHVASAPQVNPNPTFATATLVQNASRNPAVFGTAMTLQPNDLVFNSVQDIQRHSTFTGGTNPSLPTNNFQAQPTPVQNLQEPMNQPNSFMGMTQKTSETQANQLATQMQQIPPAIGLSQTASSQTALATQLQQIPPTIGLSQTVTSQTSLQSAPNSIPVSTNQATMHPNMLQQENLQFHNPFGSKEDNPVVQIMAVQGNEDQSAHNMMNASQQQMFSLPSQEQPMQMQAQMNNQGQKEFSMFAEQKNPIHQQQGVQMAPVRHQQTEAQLNISHQQNNQDIPMHVDEPFMEARNPVNIQVQTNNSAVNNNYNAQSVTRITTVSEAQSMEGVAHTQTSSQPMDHRMRDPMALSGQQQMYQQIHRHNTAISLSSDTAPASMASQGFQNQLSSNVTPMNIQSLAPGSNPAQNFQTLPQANQMSVEHFNTSQATTSPANAAFQLNIVPASVSSQIFQTQQSEQHVVPPGNAAPMQTQPYLSPESTASLSPQMATQNTTQQVYQSPPAQDQTFSPPNQALPIQTMQNQPMLVQIQAVPIENQHLPLTNHCAPLQNPVAQLQNQAGHVQNSTSPVENQGFPMQSQNLLSQNQKSPMENQAIQMQDQGLLLQSQGLTLQNQSMSVQNQAPPVENHGLSMQNRAFPVQSQITQMKNQPMAVQGQAMPGTNQTTPVPGQSLPVQNQAFLLKEQALTTQNQQIPVQTQFMSSQNQQPNTGNSTQVQITANFLYQNNNATLQQHSAADIGVSTAVHQASQQAHDRSITVRQPLEPHSPNIYAMTKLLQTIDGSENLEAISREDIQRHCQ